MEETKNSAIAIIIMAGGSGTRFWPLSQPSFPKQYLTLLGERSLIQQTVDRVLPLTDPSRIFICSGANQKNLIHDQLPEISQLILEPVGRNTAPCLMLSLDELLRRGFDPDSVMIVLPADHFITDTEGFLERLRLASRVAVETKGLITLGIVPTSPHTGYGYIEARSKDRHPVHPVFPVQRFVEKPDRARAEEFLHQKNFYWNSGIFVWTLGALAKAFEKYTPDAWKKISGRRSQDDLARIFSELESIPIDIAVLEKADNIFVIPANIGWSDVGSWDALYQLQTEGNGGNAILSGNVKTVESAGCLVKVSEGKKVALVGVKDLVIVENNGTLLIARRDKDQMVRQAAKEFEK